MLNRIKAALQNIGSPSAPSEPDISSIEFSVAILLVEVMHADHQLDEQEKIIVIQLLTIQFEIDEIAAQDLFDRANKKVNGVVSLHKYTSHVNSDLSYDDKQLLMKNLWSVVYSDGRVDKYEEHLVRRISDLIHVSHKDFIKAKHLAQENSPAC